MPRRTTTRCRRRGARGNLDVTTECCLVWGHCFDVQEWEIRTAADYATHWRVWGDEITRRWIAGVPGSRPFAMYVLGTIPPPAWQHDNPMLRHPLRPITGCGIAIPDRSWHAREIELEHLDAIGLIDDDEREAALARLADRTYRDEYRWIAHEHEAALA
jgi:hypothetical protein